MTALINSGILYLERFIEESNLLPSDLARLLSYIRALDERMQDIRIEADERLRAFVQAWRNEQHSQFPPEAHEQRMAIDSLHADLIHMQEEKNLFAQQVESLLRAKEEELHRWEASLKRELSVSDADPHQQAQPQQVQAPQPQPAQRFAAQPQPSHSFPVGLSSQPSAGSYTMLAPPGHPGTRHAGAQPAHHPHIDYGMSKPPAMHPAPAMAGVRHHMQAHPNAHMAQTAVPMPQSMMTPYIMSGPQVGGPMYAYPSMQPMEPHDPGVGDGRAPFNGLYFTPVDPSMQAHSTRPQARNGHLLTLAELSPELQGKQAEMLWPDDGKWYLIKIAQVDPQAKTANIQYLTGETENDLDLAEIVAKKEMRIIPS